jgi:anti-sigma factor RsiW
MTHDAGESIDEFTLHAALDGELDAIAMMRVEQALAANPPLAARYEALRALRVAMRDCSAGQPAPDALRQRIESMAKEASPPPIAKATRDPRRWRLSLAAALMLGFAGGGGVMRFVMREKPESTRLAMLMVDDHRRALLARESIDVASSDRHTVKPWFDARLAISPPVVDLASRGIDLVGGRADVVAGTAAPTLVYRQREHLISVTALPLPRFDAKPDNLSTGGYEARAWSDGGFVFWAVSDLPRADLEAFVLAFRLGASANENAR